MHNILNTYPSVELSRHVICKKEIANKIESEVLKHINIRYEAKVPINDTSEELRKDQGITKVLLKILGYAHAI